MDTRTLNTRKWFITGFFLVLAVAALVVGYNVTEINLTKLVTSISKNNNLMNGLIRPDLTTRATTTSKIDLVFPVPCGSAQAAPLPENKPRIAATVQCANPRDTITLQGYNLAPNNDVKLSWILPSGNALFAKWAKTDDKGSFTTTMDVRPITAAVDGVPSQIEAETAVPYGKLLPSQAVKDVIHEIVITIFMALLATTFGTLLAIPISFLAARNIMGTRGIGAVVYGITRTFMNLFRSFDSLVLAIVFALWVGFGAFAGVLALTLVTVASIGKLFSEAVESIDAGQIEALQATGADPIEVVRFAVIPQIVPDFISYIIYHWDINVRISTVLGFVGGGGIGFYLSQRINVFEYSKAATAIWAIVAVVWAMDFLSSEVRKRYT